MLSVVKVDLEAIGTLLLCLDMSEIPPCSSPVGHLRWLMLKTVMIIIIIYLGRFVELRIDTYCKIIM